MARDSLNLTVRLLKCSLNSPFLLLFASHASLNSLRERERERGGD